MGLRLLLHWCMTGYVPKSIWLGSQLTSTQKGVPVLILLFVICDPQYESLCYTHTHIKFIKPFGHFFLFLKFRQNEYPPCHPRFWKLQWFHRNQWDKFSGILRHVCSHSKLWYHWESTTVAHLVSAMSGLVSDQILTTKLACVRVTTPWLCWGDMLARCGWLTIVRNFQEHSLETPGRFSHSKNGLCHVMTDN